MDSCSIWLLCLDYGVCCCWNPAQIGKNTLSAEKAFSRMVFSVGCVRTCYFGRFCSVWFTSIDNVPNIICSIYINLIYKSIFTINTMSNIKLGPFFSVYIPKVTFYQNFLFLADVNSMQNQKISNNLQLSMKYPYLHGLD